MIWHMLIVKTHEIAINPKYDAYQRGLGSMMYKFVDKKIGSGVNVNEVLAQELHKPVIKKFRKIKVYERFKDNIWVADLAEMASLYSKSCGVKYWLCVTDGFTKYT